MSFCTAGKIVCLDLKCNSNPHGVEMGAEWSRRSGSMARPPRDIVTPLRRSSAGWMPVSIRRLSSGAGRKHPMTVRKALLTGSVGCVWELQLQARAQYSPEVVFNTPGKASDLLQECDAWCQIFAKWLEGSAIRERPVQRYSEVFRLGAKEQAFVVEVDFQLTFSFLAVKMEDCRYRFCSDEL